MPIVKKQMPKRAQIADGEHIVKVTDAVVGMSKKGDRMLTLTFANAEGHQIRGYFVMKHAWMMETLAEIKSYMGLPANAGIESMLDKKCGVLVGSREPDAEGHIFKEIQGYGKIVDVGPVRSPKEEYSESPSDTDEIPF